MSLLDDYMESSEAAHGTPTIQFGADAFISNNGFDGLENVRVDTGYVSTGFGQIEEPIFGLDYVQFQMSAKLIDMAVSNNILIVALESSRLLKVDLDNPLEVEEIEIARKQSDGKISKIFFDPTGRHLIITTDHGENYYYYEKWKKTKPLPKFKGIVITSIAWNKQAILTDPSTREVLIGTKNGLIYETCIEPNDEYFKKEEKYFKQVYSIHESTMPITGLYFEQFPVNNRKYFVMATTATRIYQFVGFVGPNNNSNGNLSGSMISNGNSDIIEDRGERAMFENLFSNYDTNPGYQELPGELDHSELHFFSRFHELQQQGIAEAFAWLTGPGIYHGSLVFGSQNIGDSVIDVVQLLQYPATPSEDESQKLVVEIPISVALTEFHFVLLYKNRVRAICQLNDQIVYEEMIPIGHGECVVGMTVDDIKKTFWIYTTLAMYELTINNEEKDVWKLYLEKKKYNSALRYCKDPGQKDKVFTAQARDYFGQRRYKMSAEIFANSTVPFEEVALMFIEKDEVDALRVYLNNKLTRLRKNEQTQKTMVATWLVELYLSKLSDLEDLASSAHHTPPSNEPVSLEPNTREFFLEQQEDICDEFRSFLETYNGNLHKPTTYHLMTRQGRTEEYLFFASLVGDYDRVISHWIAEKNWTKALSVLSKEANPEVFYKFSPVLMENEPYETNQAIRYLSHVVTVLNNTDAAIHNFLLTLYATQKTTDESALLAFLKNEGSEMHYDLDYALRLCTQNGRTQSCVHIYSQMGLYEEAVHLSLTNNDLELARINADMPEEDDALRKRLWLKIAKHVIQENKEIKLALELLKQNDLLKIEDILPFFPDFVLIDDFKEEICEALEKYNDTIDEIKFEMNEATKTGDSIRLDIRELRSR
ncbi:Pep3/Vps18/deep orange family-domain-containing protein [Sporodiniella umbellata]|nr:Pep3/Vps18/deep orange family-domain-containing protein [Sporodiniella umbellata]